MTPRGVRGRGRFLSATVVAGDVDSSPSVSVHAASRFQNRSLGRQAYRVTIYWRADTIVAPCSGVNCWVAIQKTRSNFWATFWADFWAIFVLFN